MDVPSPCFLVEQPAVFVYGRLANTAPLRE
jgi:hypothetical protein